MLPDGQSSIHKLNVTDRKQWKKAVADFGKQAGGRMDVFFNNAGIGEGGAIEEMTDEEIDQTIAVNLTGVISGTRACFDMLKNTPGSCLLYIASAAGIYGVADLSVYSASKFGVRGLAESHDLEFRQHDIKVACLMPGFVDTNIIGNVVEGTNITGKEALQDAGVMVSPVSIIGPAAWGAVHGKKLHTPVNKMAEKLAFAARWMPGRLRKQMVGLGGERGLGEVLGGSNS